MIPKLSSGSVNSYLADKMDTQFLVVDDKEAGDIAVYYGDPGHYADGEIPHIGVKDEPSGLYRHKMGEGCMFLCDPDALVGGLYDNPAMYLAKLG